MSERNYLEDKLFDFFQGILDDIDCYYPLIYEGENGVRPVPPFLSIQFNSIRLLGTTPYFKENVEEIEVEGEKKYLDVSKQPVERTLTLRGFGTSTEEVLNEIRSLLEFDAYRAKINKDKIVIKNVEDIIENYNNYSEDEEKFFSMDFIVSYERIENVENSYIGSVEITSEGLEKPNEEKTAPVDILIEEDS